MQGNGVGPARLGELHGARLGHTTQLLRQLVDLSLGLGIHGELVLHRDARQLLPELPNLSPQVDLVLGDSAGQLEEEVDRRPH